MKVRQHHDFSLWFKFCNCIFVKFGALVGVAYAALTILDYVNKLIHELGIVREAKGYVHIVFKFEDIWIIV